uniref:Uncharacterized protein n=1 Tax=Pararge aegeria TaxID=116150 RepID=S4P777_9NEOP
MFLQYLVYQVFLNDLTLPRVQNFLHISNAIVSGKQSCSTLHARRNISFLYSSRTTFIIVVDNVEPDK